jgi:aldehyde dehydrogenase (NAD+)
MNSGQACVAGTRVLVPEGRMAEILARLKAEVEAVRAGDPTDPEVSVGPMVSRKQWDRVQSYLKLGQEEGATLLVGGEGRPEGLERGWFVQPTVFANVTNDMRIAREEIFGPVLSVIGYATEEDAIAIANDTTYGLQSYVLSSDPVRARRVAARLEAGRVVINGAPHEPLAPFGASWAWWLILSPRRSLALAIVGVSRGRDRPRETPHRPARRRSFGRRRNGFLRKRR